MEKIAIVTDTAADLPEKFIKENNINVLAFRIIYKDKEYRDKIDITSEEVYKNLEVEVPKSSMPSLQDMDDLYSRLEEEGYTHVIGITISSGLSGMFNGIKMIADDHPKIKSFIYDSKILTMGEGVLVIECAKLVNSKKSFDEIVEEIPKIRKRIHGYFVVGTLDYLRKGGRIGRIAGTIGKFLNIKPIITVDENGIYYAYDKVRGRKQSLNRLLEIARSITEKHKCKAYIIHGYAEEEAKEFSNKVKQINNITEVNFSGCLGPVMGVHSGPGLVAIVLLEE